MQTVVPATAGYMPNDLVFDAHGGLYFSDFRGISTEPKGGAYYVSPDSRTITPLLAHLAMANGIALSPDGKELWITEFSRNLLHRVELASPTEITPIGTAITYHFIGPAPDSMRADNDGNLYVASTAKDACWRLTGMGSRSDRYCCPAGMKGTTRSPPVWPSSPTATISTS